MPSNNSSKNGNGDRVTTTIDVEKELFLKFKALCVLKEKKLSKEIERLIERRVNEFSKSTEIRQ